MSKVTDIGNNMLDTIKKVIIAFVNGARYFWIHATLSIITLIAIIWWLFDDVVQLEGAAAVLLIYTFYNVIHLNASRIRIKYLEDTLDEWEILYKKENK